MRVLRWMIPFVALAAVAVALTVAVRSGRLHLPLLAPQLGSALPPLSDGSPASAWPHTVLLTIAGVAGWVLSFLLAVLLVRLVGQWKTTFEAKEWLLIPSDRGRQLQGALDALMTATISHFDTAARRLATSREELKAVATAIQETRAEFSILRDELDSKTKEVAVLRLGQEFHLRRPVLMRVIRALDIIDDDLTHQRDVRQTLEGVRVELRECLDENAVSTYTPEIGSRLTDAKGVDIQGAMQEPTKDDALKGTIASTDRPAYIVRGALGAEEILVPAKVRVYVEGA